MHINHKAYMTSIITSLLFICLILPLSAGASSIKQGQLPDKLVGKSGHYTPKQDEPLRKIAGKLGCNTRYLADSNGLKPNAVVKAGQTIRFNNLRIVPKSEGRQILVNIPDRTIYLYDESGRLQQYAPVAVGQPGTPTPTGSFKIISKTINPVWRVPQSIQDEMRKQGKKVQRVVPPGPNNPLGSYAMRTSLPNILIHSTSKPASIYGFNSHGCVRVDPGKIEKVYKQVQPRMNGEIMYQPIKLAAKDDGRIFIEVHKNVYSRRIDMQVTARKLLERHGLENNVDWAKVKQAIAKQDGFAIEINRQMASKTNPQRLKG